MASADCPTVVESIDERAHLIHDEGWAFGPCARELAEGLVPTGTPKIDAGSPRRRPRKRESRTALDNRQPDAETAIANFSSEHIKRMPTLPLLAELGILLSGRSR